MNFCDRAGRTAEKPRAKLKRDKGSGMHAFPGAPHAGEVKRGCLAWFSMEPAGHGAASREDGSNRGKE